MDELDLEEIEQLNDLSKCYEIIEEFVNNYNNINYISFDYNIVHNFTLFVVDPDFDFPKLESQINRISKSLGPIKRIFAKPVLHLTERDEILPIEAVKKINNDTINHIARHSELWDDFTPIGIKPIKLLSRMYEDNYGIYENLVFCKTIDDILFFVRRNMRTLKNYNYVNQRMEFDLLQRVNHLNYFLALGKLHTGYIRNFDKYYVISKHCLNGLNNIYNTIVPRLKRPVYRKNKKRPNKLKKTNILGMHKDYKHIYSLEKYFSDNKMEISYDVNEGSVINLGTNYFNFCSILSIFSIGHFNFKCDDSQIMDFTNLNVDFKYKGWNLNLKTQNVDEIKVLNFQISKDKDYSITIIPSIHKDNSIILDKVKNNIVSDEYIVCFPYELNTYEPEEMCVDLSNIDSFRRIQRLILRGMILTDTQRNECPFCQHPLIPGNKEGIYECESCKTVIVDSICPTTNKTFTYTDILGYEKEVLNIDNYKEDEWLYYRKKEGLLHFRNITDFDEDGNPICPICNKVH